MNLHQLSPLFLTKYTPNGARSRYRSFQYLPWLNQALDRFNEPLMLDAIDRLVQLTQTPGIHARCREVAMRYFSLDQGAARYRAIYDDLSKLKHETES